MIKSCENSSQKKICRVTFFLFPSKSLENGNSIFARGATDPWVDTITRVTFKQANQSTCSHGSDKKGKANLCYDDSNFHFFGRDFARFNTFKEGPVKQSFAINLKSPYFHCSIHLCIQNVNYAHNSQSKHGFCCFLNVYTIITFDITLDKLTRQPA